MSEEHEWQTITIKFKGLHRDVDQYINDFHTTPKNVTLASLRMLPYPAYQLAKAVIAAAANYRIEMEVIEDEK